MAFAQVLEEETMDKNPVAGSTNEINGTVKQVPSLALALFPRLLLISAGQVVGYDEVESDGEVDKAGDRIPNAIRSPNDVLKAKW